MFTGPLVDVSLLADFPTTTVVYKTRVLLTDEGANTEAYNLDFARANMLSSAIVAVLLLDVVLLVLVGILEELGNLDGFAKGSTVPSSNRRA